MLRRLFLLGCVMQLATPAPGSGQARSVGSDLEDIGKDAWTVFSAPADASGEDLVTAGLIAGGGALLLLTDAAAHDWMTDNQSSLLVRALAPFRLGGPLEPLGTTPAIATLAAITWLSGVAFDHTGLRDAGAGCLATSVASVTVRQVLMMSLPRARPSEGRGAFAFEPPGLRGWPMGSMPGGHGANAAACYSTLTHRFDFGVAEPILWTIPLALGMARLPDEAHWLSDTYLGLSLGYAIGRSIGGRLLDREVERAPSPALMLVGGVRF